MSGGLDFWDTLYKHIAKRNIVVLVLFNEYIKVNSIETSDT